jgi:hypothetical protein
MNQQIEQEDTAGSPLNGCDAFWRLWEPSRARSAW